MKCEIIKVERLIGWDMVLAMAKATQWKVLEHKEPSDEWKRKIVAAPHSPIRALTYAIQFTCPYFVSVHLVRHHEGVQWFVGSQRNDRQDKYDRNAARQDAEVMVTCIINAEALMFISRRRLCNQASPETRETWQEIIGAVRNIDPILADHCVPECVYRGFCPEFRSCGFADSTSAFDSTVKMYREVK